MSVDCGLAPLGANRYHARSTSGVIVPSAAPLIESALSGVPRLRQGKVRDLYQVGDDVLIVATDRISAFDYVLGSGIPDKGRVLTQLSAFWFARTGAIVANHVISADVDAFPAVLAADADQLRGRAMLVRRTTPLPIECVARGYLSGSGWKDYLASGAVCGHALPPGLRESDRLPAPLFTPATKADSGHDINISEAEAATLLGADVFARVKTLTMALYAFGSAHAATCGILLADTKFEFGLTDAGELLLIDEAMTPDSSRYWPADQYAPGGPQPSFDKQFVRDYLESIRWNKQPPVPSLPDEVVSRTRAKYLEAYERLTGRRLETPDA
jgi:phosphoribosylaminoimidazole-succinocarboxamide synthase